RQLARDLRHHLLDQEAAERHAGEAALAVGDRVEYRGVDAILHHRLALGREDRRDRIGDLAGERHLDEDQRLVDQRRMEERIATPVGRIDARAQVLPVAYLVHRLVLDDLLEDYGGRRPGASTQHPAGAGGTIPEEEEEKRDTTHPAPTA